MYSLQRSVLSKGANKYFLLHRVLHPLNKNSKHETTVKWKTADPEFHEQFVYLTSSAELPKQTLHITVWDRGKNSPDKYIGNLNFSTNSEQNNRPRFWNSSLVLFHSSFFENTGSFHVLAPFRIKVKFSIRLENCIFKKRGMTHYRRNVVGSKSWKFCQWHNGIMSL